jgi:hypothetical protein
MAMDLMMGLIRSRTHLFGVGAGIKACAVLLVLFIAHNLRKPRGESRIKNFARYSGL